VTKENVFDTVLFINDVMIFVTSMLIRSSKIFSEIERYIKHKGAKPKCHWSGEVTLIDGTNIKLKEREFTLFLESSHGKVEFCILPGPDGEVMNARPIISEEDGVIVIVILYAYNKKGQIELLLINEIRQALEAVDGLKLVPDSAGRFEHVETIGPVMGFNHSKAVEKVSDVLFDNVSKEVLEETGIHIDKVRKPSGIDKICMNQTWAEKLSSRVVYVEIPYLDLSKFKPAETEFVRGMNFYSVPQVIDMFSEGRYENSLFRSGPGCTAVAMFLFDHKWELFSQYFWEIIKEFIKRKLSALLSRLDFRKNKK